MWRTAVGRYIISSCLKMSLFQAVIAVAIARTVITPAAAQLMAAVTFIGAMLLLLMVVM